MFCKDRPEGLHRSDPPSGSGSTKAVGRAGHVGIRVAVALDRPSTVVTELLDTPSPELAGWPTLVS